MCRNGGKAGIFAERAVKTEAIAPAAADRPRLPSLEVFDQPGASGTFA
jgi:hypothetical protein